MFGVTVVVVGAVVVGEDVGARAWPWRLRVWGEPLWLWCGYWRGRGCRAIVAVVHVDVRVVVAVAVAGLIEVVFSVEWV